MGKTLKVLLIGKSGVGKTSAVARLLYGPPPSPTTGIAGGSGLVAQPTIEDFYECSVALSPEGLGKSFLGGASSSLPRENVRLIDLGGVTSASQIPRHHLPVDGYVLFYDAQDESSYHSMISFHKEMILLSRDKKEKEIPCLVTGINKLSPASQVPHPHGDLESPTRLSHDVSVTSGFTENSTDESFLFSNSSMDVSPASMKESIQALPTESTCRSSAVLWAKKMGFLYCGIELAPCGRPALSPTVNHTSSTQLPLTPAGPTTSSTQLPLTPAGQATCQSREGSESIICDTGVFTFSQRFSDQSPPPPAPSTQSTSSSRLRTSDQLSSSDAGSSLATAQDADSMDSVANGSKTPLFFTPPLSPHCTALDAERCDGVIQFAEGFSKFITKISHPPPKSSIFGSRKNKPT